MKVTNNPLCIVLNAIRSTIKGRLLKWSLLARNRVNSTMAILEIISTIEIKNTPCSGIGKLFTLTGYSSGLLILPEDSLFTYD